MEDLLLTPSVRRLYRISLKLNGSQLKGIACSGQLALVLIFVGFKYRESLTKSTLRPLVAGESPRG